MNRLRQYFTISVISFLSIVRATHGQDEPRIELIVEEDKVAWVGEKIPVYVELKAPGLFTGSPRFGLPALPGAVILKENQRPSLRTERIGETTFNVQRHAFAIYSQAAGQLSVPAFNVSFSSSPEASEEPIATSLATPEFDVQIRMPPGAESSAIIITTTEFSVDETWGEIPEKVKVGDAFTRSITVRAKDVPSMTLPPIPFERADGVDVYPKTPRLDDKNNRGQIQAERIDQVTYVCKKPGMALIPAMKLQWWDPEKERLQIFELEKKELQIAPTEVIPRFDDVAEDSEADNDNSSALIAWGAALALLGVGFLITWRFYLRNGWSTLRDRMQNSERARYRQMANACRHHDAVGTYNALTRWIADFGPQESRSSLDSFLRAIEFDVDRTVFDELLRSVQRQNAQWTGHELLTQLDAIRRSLNHNEMKSNSAVLAPLNPFESSPGQKTNHSTKVNSRR